MASNDSDAKLYAFLFLVGLVTLFLYYYQAEIQQFENNTKIFVLNLFTLSNALIVASILLVFLTIRKVIHNRIAKREAKEWEERERHFREEERKQKILQEEKERQEEAERKEWEKIQTALLKKKYPVRRIRETESNFVDGKKSYLKDSLEESESRYLLTTGYIEVRNASLAGKKEDYLVLSDKNESPSHIICIEEVVDYIKKFTEEIDTFRSVKPDIVFEVNGKEFAIEVETGKINNLKRLQEKVFNLKKYYGKNWFFLVTDRNLRSYYKRFGVTYSKRNIKGKIKKLFKNSKKKPKLAVNCWG